MPEDAVTAILEWWFGIADADGLVPADHRQRWFAGGKAADLEIRRRFGTLVSEALRGGLREWRDRDPNALALILLTDQFTRNIGRNTPDMFAGDPVALATARTVLDASRDQHYPRQQRVFLYMPLMHAEDLVTQRECVRRFQDLAAGADNDAQRRAFAANVEFAVRHCEIIERFGRFPHRNAILGRPTTPKEAAFLTRPGSSF